MTAEGHCNIVWGGDYKDTLRLPSMQLFVLRIIKALQVYVALLYFISRWFYL